MEVFASWGEGAADFFEELLNLFADRSAAGGDHFGDQQAGEDAVFFRDVAANGEAGAFFSAEGDFVLANELADVFEADGSLIGGLTVELCGGVDEFRSGNAACGGHVPSAGFDEVIVDERENKIGLDPRAVGIDDAKAVGVAVGGESGGGFGGEDEVAEGGEIFFADVGAGAVEQHVAIGANGFDRDAVIGENLVEVARAAAVQGVDGEFGFGFGEDVEFYELLETLEIIFAEIGFFDLSGVGFEWSDSACGEKSCGTGFNVLGDFGKSGAGICRRKFQAVILRGIVAGGEIDGTVQFAALNLVGDGGSRSEGVAEQRADTVRLQNGDGKGGKFLGVETSVVTDENGGLGGFGFNVFGDGGDGETHVGEGEIVGDQSAPAGSAEFDGRWSDRGRGAHFFTSIVLTESLEYGG